MLPFPEDFRSVLCVVAHPDDLEYGAASAVARWTSEGKRVVYTLVTSGEAGIDGTPPAECGPLREGEERAGAAAVGVETVDFLGYTDGAIEYGLPLRRDIAATIRRHQPQLVVTLHRGMFWQADAEIPTLNMADHRNVGLAVLDAARDAGNRWIFTDLAAGGLEPWNGVRWVAFAGSDAAKHAVDVTGFLTRGIESLRAHKAYIDGLGGDSFDADAFLRANAERTGAALGVEHAVAFELVGI